MLDMAVVTAVLIMHVSNAEIKADDKINVWAFHFSLAKQLNIEVSGAYQQYILVWLGELVNALILFGLIYISTTLIFRFMTLVRNGNRR